NNFYIDCGDDWQLYIHDKNSKAEVPKKLPFSIEELIGKAPIVLPHGVLIGSKNTSVFLIDPKTGNVIQTFKSDSDSEQSSIVVKKGAPEKWKEPNNFDHRGLIFLKRIDYKLILISANGEILSSLSVADFDASRQCDGSTIFLDISKGDPLVPGFVQPPKVFRVRLPRDFEAFLRTLPLVHGGEKFYLMPPNHESSPFAPAQLPESIFVNDPENPHQLVPYIPPIPHKPDDKHAKDASITHVILASIKMWVLAALSIFIPLIVSCWNFGRRKQNKLNETVTVTKVQNVTPKKKKPRKSGNSRVDANTEKIMNGFQFTGSFERSKNTIVFLVGNETGDVISTFKSDATKSSEQCSIILKKVLPRDLTCQLLLLERFDYKRRNQNKLNETVMVTKVQNVTPKKKKPWKSGNSRVDGRRVFVKRIVKVYYEVALKEIQNLIGSDEHTNIARWHGVDSSTQVQSSMEVFKDFKLWKPNGYPSPVPLKVMRDTASGLAYLHELRIIHRDLKPQNVLLRRDRSIITTKFSDMGYGSSVWQAPKQLRKERQTRAVDLFSFGCVLFFCITGG
nr:serine/threonine-protein kinase/endoribonuclease IRE1b-like [Tanacetum cinerariifolium]